MTIQTTHAELTVVYLSIDHTYYYYDETFLGSMDMYLKSLVWIYHNTVEKQLA
jgi:hypothetical protein